MPTVNELAARRGPQTDKSFTRIYHRSIEVIFSESEAFSGALACIATGVSLWQPHPEDLNALCINFDPKSEQGDPRYWVVDLQYSSAVEIAEDGQPVSQSNPMERKARVRKSGRRYTEAIIRDINGTLLRNFAHDPYDHSEDRVRAAYLIQRDLPYGQAFGGKPPFESIAIEDYMGAINSAPFLGCFPKEVLCDDLEAEMKNENGNRFWEVQAVFVINRIKIVEGVESGGWVTRKLNAGLRELINGKHVEIRDQFGRVPSRPALLDGNGRKLDPGTPAAPATPIYRHFYTKPEADFTLLGLLT